MSWLPCKEDGTTNVDIPESLAFGYGLHRVSAMAYWGCGRLARRVAWSVRTMASWVWRLGEGVRREYILHGDIELPCNTMCGAVAKIYRELAHGAADRRRRRVAESP